MAACRALPCLAAGPGGRGGGVHIAGGVPALSRSSLITTVSGSLHWVVRLTRVCILHVSSGGEVLLHPAAGHSTAGCWLPLTLRSHVEQRVAGDRSRWPITTVAETTVSTIRKIGVATKAGGCCWLPCCSILHVGVYRVARSSWGIGDSLRHAVAGIMMKPSRIAHIRSITRIDIMVWGHADLHWRASSCWLALRAGFAQIYAAL